jgi:hypothetical protein
MDSEIHGHLLMLCDFVITRHVFSASSDWSSVDQLKGINVLLSPYEHCLECTVEVRF